MAIFGALKRGDGEKRSHRSTMYLPSPPSPAEEVGHRSLKSALSHSVKALFAKKTPRSQSVIVKHMSSAPALNIETDPLVHEPVRRSQDSQSRARAQILAETARRLELGASARSPSPITPSSISTGRTLPCFPEEEEFDNYEYHDTSASSSASPMPSYSSSVTSSRTFTNRNRPSSVFGDSPSPRNSD
ncbi:hypothetical protein FBU59_004610, partial [Linderina macrospora]